MMLDEAPRHDFIKLVSARAVRCSAVFVFVLGGAAYAKDVDKTTVPEPRTSSVIRRHGTKLHLVLQIMLRLAIRAVKTTHVIVLDSAPSSCCAQLGTLAICGPAR